MQLISLVQSLLTYQDNDSMVPRLLLDQSTNPKDMFMNDSGATVMSLSQDRLVSQLNRVNTGKPVNAPASPDLVLDAGTLAGSIASPVGAENFVLGLIIVVTVNNGGGSGINGTLSVSYSIDGEDPSVVNTESLKIRHQANDVIAGVLLFSRELKRSVRSSCLAAMSNTFPAAMNGGTPLAAPARDIDIAFASGTIDNATVEIYAIIAGRAAPEQLMNLIFPD